MPSDISKSEVVAVRQDANSSQSPESIRSATVEPGTKTQLPQALLAPEAKEAKQKPLELPSTQPQPQASIPPEVHSAKVIVSPFMA